MNREDLLDGFGTLDDDLLKRSERGGKRPNILLYGSMAACLAVLLSAGILFMNSKNPNPAPGIPEGRDIAGNNHAKNSNVISNDVEKDNPLNDNAVNDNNVSDVQKPLQGDPEKYVDVSTLLASNEGMNELQGLEIKFVEIGDYSACYNKIVSVESDLLRESIGGEIPGTQTWYRVSGHEDMQYLISGDSNEYSLWKFDSFRQESYPYCDVLQIIYNIHSAEDIAKIIVTPANMDSTEEGKAIQDEIGTSVIADNKAIETIYNMLSRLTCYGKNHWDMIGLGEDTPSAMLSQVRAGRYLTMITSRGMEIDTLKYTGISGMFYEYGGIAYSALTAEERAAVEDILDIEWSRESEAGGTTHGIPTDGNIPINGNTPAEKGVPTNGDIPADRDVPVKEETYSEAREYSAELIDLQNRISEAMMNKELPFVTKSAIYENPDRLHVTVNTTDEDLIARLRAFDTTGRLLEIEYSGQREITDFMEKYALEKNVLE